MELAARFRERASSGLVSLAEKRRERPIALTHRSSEEPGWRTRVASLLVGLLILATITSMPLGSLWVSNIPPYGILSLCGLSSLGVFLVFLTVVPRKDGRDSAVLRVRLRVGNSLRVSIEWLWDRFSGDRAKELSRHE